MKTFLANVILVLLAIILLRSRPVYVIAFDADETKPEDIIVTEDGPNSACSPEIWDAYEQSCNRRLISVL